MKINLKKLKEVGERIYPSPWIKIGSNHNTGMIHGEYGQISLSEKERLFIVEARNNWDAMVEALEQARFLLEFHHEASYEGCDDTAKFLKERFEDE